MQNLVVVVPCFNEANRFSSASFADAARLDHSLSFVLVDDGSKDRTRKVLERLRRTSKSQFSVLSLDQNCGKAEAVRQGMQRAFGQSPSLVAYLDADLATPLAELGPMRLLFASHPELEMVLGSRVALLGREVVRSPSRHYLGRVFASLASLCLGFTVYDTQCGAKVFRNTAAVRSVFAQAFPTRWTFDVEILARLNALATEGAISSLQSAAAECPLESWHDVSGSKLGAGAAFGAGVELASLWLRYHHGWKRDLRTPEAHAAPPMFRPSGIRELNESILDDYLPHATPHQVVKS